MPEAKKSLLANPKLIPLFSLTTVFLWGCAFPFIKLGMAAFGIEGDNTGGKILFAGMRFVIAGVAVLIAALMQGHSLGVKNKKIWLYILLFGFVNTTLHYLSFYIGLSNSTGSRSSIFDSTNTFIFIFAACAFFPDEHITKRKILGCLIGFSGILLINIGGVSEGAFTLKGDGMLLCNACCGATGGMITRVISRKTDIFTATGYSMTFGGIMLLLIGIPFGGTIPQVNLHGCAILAFLIFISAVGFSFYNQLLSYHPVDKIAIYNSVIPLAGAMLSCVFLHEPFQLKYIAAGILIASGVYIINRQ